jgi:hypothetical protein
MKEKTKMFRCLIHNFSDEPVALQEPDGLTHCVLRGQEVTEIITDRPESSFARFSSVTINRDGETIATKPNPDWIPPAGSWEEIVNIGGNLFEAVVRNGRTIRLLKNVPVLVPSDSPKRTELRLEVVNTCLPSGYVIEARRLSEISS